MALSSEVTSGAATPQTKGEGSTKFATNAFLHEAPSTKASIKENEKGRKLIERIRHRKDKDGSRPEYFTFKEDTKGEMTEFLTRWAYNVDVALHKPDGKDALDGQPHAKGLAFALGINEGDTLNDSELKRRINAALKTPEGWVAAKVLLDQETAINSFAAAIAYLGQDPKHKTHDSYAEYLKHYVDNEGKIHKLGRHAGKKMLTHWTKTATGGLAATAFGIGTAASAGNPLIGAAAAGGVLIASGIAKGGYEAGRGGRRTEADVCKEALEFIQQNEKVKKYVKYVSRMDADDFVVDNKGNIRIAPGLEQQDLGSRHNPGTFIEQVLENTATRQKYYRDLGVPLSTIDATPEKFIFSNTGMFERTQERVHSDMVDIYQSLRKAARDEIRRTGPKETVTEDEQRDNLLTDADARKLDDPLNGRGYLPGVDLPSYEKDNVIEKYQDKWKQVEPDWEYDEPPWSAAISAPIRDENGWTYSDWHGQAPENEVCFLGSTATPFSPGDRERVPYSLQRKGKIIPHPTEPSPATVTVHDNDPRGRLYEYTYDNKKDLAITAEDIQNNLTFITDQGEKIIVNSDPARIRRLPAPPTGGRERYQFFDSSLGTPAWVNVDPDKLFYVPPYPAVGVSTDLPFVPTDAKLTPIPFGALESIPPAVLPPFGTMEPPRSYRYDASKPAVTVTVGENAFFRIPGRERQPDGTITVRATETKMFGAYDALNVDNFYRDTLSHVPLGNPDSFLYGTGFSHDQLITRDRIAFIATQYLGRDDIKPDEIRSYFEENFDDISDDKLRVISRAERYFSRSRRRTEFPPRQITDSLYKAEDDRGVKPTDIRFGIYDNDILDALDKLGGPNMANFRPATGKDQWGQDRSNPFFCRANRKSFSYTELSSGTLKLADLTKTKADTAGPAIFLLDKMAKDQWGQEPKYPDRTPNLFFMKANEETYAGTAGRSDLELWVRARETVLANVTENLIKRMRLFPTRNVSTIEAKLRSRESGGERLKAMIEESRKDAPLVKKAKDILAARAGSTEAHKKAKDELSKAQADLVKYIPDVFGGSITSPVDATTAIDQALLLSSASTAPLDVKFEGKSYSIIPIAEQRKKALADRQKNYGDIRTANPLLAKETPKQWDARLQPEFDAAEEVYAEARTRWEDHARILTAIKAQIASYEATVTAKTEDIKIPDGKLTKALAEALRPTAKDKPEVDKLVAFLDATTTGTPPSSVLGKESVTQLLQRINTQNETDATFGWDTTENESDEKMKLVLYAMIEGRVKESGKTDTDDLRTELITQHLKQVTQRETQIDNLEKTTLKDPTLLKERGDLKVTLVAMKRQGTMFGATAQFMSEIRDRLPVDDKDTIKKLSDLSDSELTDLGVTKDKSGALELPTGITDAMPAGLLNLYNEIFGWKGRADQKDFLTKVVAALPPDELIRIMHGNAEETIPALRAGIADFIHDLHHRTRELQISRRNLRRMFIGVVDHLENRSLNLYDPEGVVDDPAKIAKNSLGLAA